MVSSKKLADAKLDRVTGEGNNRTYVCIREFRSRLLVAAAGIESSTNRVHEYEMVL